MELGLEILAGRDVAEVVIVAVGAGDHVAAAAEGGIGEDGHVLDADGPKGAGVGAEPGADFLSVRGAEERVAHGGAELGFAELVIAAQQHEDGVAVGHQHQALHLGAFGQAGERRDFGDGLAAGGVERLGVEVALGIGGRGSGGAGDSLLHVGRVVARPAHDHVILARFGGHHELVRLVAAHGARVGLDREVAQPAAVEDAAVGAVVLVVGGVEAVVVHVEGVGVLHEELAHAQQAAFRPRLVAELGLDLVPDLGKLLVAAQFAAGEDGYDLLVGHTQAEVALEAVLEAEHIVAHDVPAAGLPPDFGGVQGGQMDLLPADGVHLLPHDSLDLEQGALGEEEVAVDAGCQLADVAGAQQQLVAGDFSFGGNLPQGGDEQLGPEHRIVFRLRGGIHGQARSRGHLDSVLFTDS